MSSAMRAARTAREQNLLYDVFLTATGPSRSDCAKVLRDLLPDCDLQSAIALMQKPKPVILLKAVTRRTARALQDRLLAAKAKGSLQAITPRGPVFRAKINESSAPDVTEVPQQHSSGSPSGHTLECEVSKRLFHNHQGCRCVCHEETQQ